MHEARDVGAHVVVLHSSAESDPLTDNLGGTVVICHQVLSPTGDVFPALWRLLRDAESWPWIGFWDQGIIDGVIVSHLRQPKPKH